MLPATFRGEEKRKEKREMKRMAAALDGEIELSEREAKKKKKRKREEGGARTRAQCLA